MEIRDWLGQAVNTLASSDTPRRDAEILLAFVTGRSRSWLIAFDDSELDSRQLSQLAQLLTRRAQGEPVAYLTGQREFWSLPLQVSPATLIPRPETEMLVEQALARLPPEGGVLDLGTGSGAVALAIARDRPDCHVTGVDRIPGAVLLAQRNAQRLQIRNVTFKQSDWFSALAGQRFALIVSNPPYIDAADKHLQQGDVRFEPRSALVAADAGLADIRHIAQHASRHLLTDGWLLLEHGWQQGSAVRDILSSSHFYAVETCQDYSGNERVTLGKTRQK